MKTQYVLMILSFAGFAMAGYRDSVTTRFTKLQNHLDLIGAETYYEFNKIDKDLDTREAPIKKDVLGQYSRASADFLSQQSQRVAEAKKKGKDPVNIEICVKLEQAKYLMLLFTKKNEAITRINTITKTARIEVKKARDTFQTDSFVDFVHKKFYGNKWETCMVQKNDPCLEELAKNYMENIATSQRVAKETRAEATIAYKKQDADLNACLAEVKANIPKLLKQHEDNVAQCIANPTI